MNYNKINELKLVNKLKLNKFEKNLKKIWKKIKKNLIVTNWNWIRIN